MLIVVFVTRHFIFDFKHSKVGVFCVFIVVDFVGCIDSIGFVDISTHQQQLF